MSLAKGIGAHIGFGVETTWGTAGTVDTFHKIISESLRHVKEPYVSESLQPGWHEDLYYGHGRNEGSIVTEFGYTGLEHFLWALFGTYTYTNDLPVAGTDTHAFTYDPDNANFPAGLTIEAVRGVGGSDERKYLGMLPTKLTLDMTPNQLMRATWDFVGQGVTKGAATAETFPADNFVDPRQVALLSVNGIALTIRSGTIEMEVMRDGQREHYGDTEVKFPEIIDQPQAFFNFECDFDNTSPVDTEALLAAFEDDTELTGPVIQHSGDIITGATNYSMTISGTNCKIMEATPATQGREVTGVTVRGRIYNGLGITLVNATNEAT